MAHDWGDRPRPPLVGDERTVLDGWLDFHRATLLWKCEGLTLAQLRRHSVPTSSMTLLGLVRHLTDVERGWFLDFLGTYDGPVYSSDDNPEGDWDDVPTQGSLRDIQRYGVEVDAIRDQLAGHSLDEQQIDGERTYSLRWIYTHMIEEYARHNGHADLIREAIDGRVGE